MLDYEIKGYTVYWEEVGSVTEFSREFDAEEAAIAFIKENITKWWMNWRIEQRRIAIIYSWED